MLSRDASGIKWAYRVVMLNVLRFISVLIL